jgi:hypothetical protein
MIATRGLRVPANAAWRGEFESELLRFPAGVHDDIVDALGLVGQLLDKALDGAKPETPKAETVTGYSVGHEYDSGSDMMLI